MLSPEEKRTSDDSRHAYIHCPPCPSCALYGQLGHGYATMCASERNQNSAQSRLLLISMAFVEFRTRILSILRGGRSCHEAINHPIRISRSGRRITSKRDMKSAAFRKKRRSAEPGRRKIKCLVEERSRVQARMKKNPDCCLTASSALSLKFSTPSLSASRAQLSMPL